MVAEWLFQSVEVPLWGVFVLTAYSARRLAAAVGGLERLRRQNVRRTRETDRRDVGSTVSE